MSHTEHKRIPFLLWPFYAIWRLLTGILGLTGRLVAIVLGLALLVIGIILSLTVVGALIGVPIALFGFMLIVRGLF